MISIVLVTFNRLPLLRQCIANVLQRTSSETAEIVVWNNASTDGTREFLDGIQDNRIRVVHSKRNIGTNAYGVAFPMTRGEILIELDDDVIDAPAGWDSTMLDAFKRIPRIGYLAADVIDDGKSVASDIRYRKYPGRYVERVLSGITVVDGPAGGWCAMTSRAVFDEVGGFPISKRFNFWLEDAAYIRKVLRAGYGVHLVNEPKVFHASGPAYSSDPEVTQAKNRYFDWHFKWLARRKAIRRLIDRVPMLGTVYAKFRPHRRY